MSDHRSKLILSVLLVVSLLTILTAAMGWLPADETAAKLGLWTDAIRATDHISAGEDSPSDLASDPGSDADGDAVQEDLQEFQIANSPSVADSSGQLANWPAESTLEPIRSVDLAAWIGRERDQKPLAGVTIFLDPGHGGIDTGALYPAHAEDNPQAVEAAINLAVAQKTQTELEALGATVLLIREDDTWLSIFYRIAWTGRYLTQAYLDDLAEAGYRSEPISQLLEQLDQVMTINSDTEESGGRGLMLGEGTSADLRVLLDLQAQFPEALYLSIHCNSIDDDSNANGLQVFYLTGATAYRKENDLAVERGLANASPVYRMYQDESRRRLADLVQDSILDLRPDLAYQGLASVIDENYAVLRELNLTSVLIEMGFISNSRDRELLLSSAGQQQMADGIAEAVYRYYCLP